jgi:hypothetical protein
VTSISRADEQQLTEQDAAEAGFDSVADLIKWCRAKGNGDLYRIGITLAGPDPRIELRRKDNLDPADVTTLNAKLDRMDRAAENPWTRNTLRQIQRMPGVVSTELAAEVGQERQAYKIRVRRLKALGLTESLDQWLSPLTARSGLSRGARIVIVLNSRTIRYVLTAVLRNAPEQPTWVGCFDGCVRKRTSPLFRHQRYGLATLRGRVLRCLCKYSQTL